MQFKSVIALELVLLNFTEFLDICALSDTDLISKDTIYIGIKCDGNCAYNIRVLYEKEFKMEISKASMSFNFLDDSLNLIFDRK